MRVLLQSEQFSNIPSSKIEKILSHINVYPIKPLLFTSANLNKESLQKYETNIPTLLANITNTILSKNATQLKDFNSDWINGSTDDKPELFQKISNFVNKKNQANKELPNESVTLDKLLDSFKEKMTMWKGQMVTCERTISGALIQKAQDHNQNPTPESLSAFIFFARQWWERRIVEQILINWEKILVFCSNILNECAKSVKLPQSSQKEKTRLQQILIVCIS